MIKPSRTKSTGKVFAILLGISYLIRKVLKKNWMKLHRLLTVLFAVSLVIHVFQMGITLPYAISTPGKEVSNSETSDVVKENEIKYSDSLVTFAGATYSSKGIQNAVNNALQSAVIDGEIKITDIQIKVTHGKKKHRK